MKQTRYRLIFTALAAVALLLASCSKEPAAEQTPGATRLSLTIDGGSISAQSGTRAVSEGAVNDLWVLQFDASGSQLTRQYIASVTNATSIVLTTELSATANSTLYLVANTGNASLFTTQTLAQAKAITVALTTTTGGGIPTDASTSLPMVGQSAALTFPISTAIPVNLTRTVAKVTLTIKNPLATDYPQLTVQSVQLKNVPNTYSMQVVNRASGFTGTTYYPAALAANFTNYTAVSGNISAAGTTSTYYLAPNVRGISTNTDDRLKSDLTAVSGQGDFCTYVEILGTAKASATAPEVNVRYRLYLGGNNTNDFNIESNTAYKVGIELTGINGNDARMTITTNKFDLSQGDTDGDNAGDTGDGWIEPLPVIGALKGGGIVYWIDSADPTNCKVFSLDQRARAAWSAKDTYVIAGAQSNTDGKANVAAIKDYFKSNPGGIITESTFEEAFPAAGFCEAKNTGGVTGWYLPAKDELNAFYQIYKATQIKLDKAIIDNGGTPITNTAAFCSSTEHLYNTTYFYYVDFSMSGYIDGINKINFSGYVRCIRAN